MNDVSREEFLPPTREPDYGCFKGDARDLGMLDPSSVDVVVTSPPYWRKRDYGVEDQVGQESTPEEYVAHILDALAAWRRTLRRSGSVFLNIGDTYWKRSLSGIPGRIEAAARDEGWFIRNRIVWAKPNGMPDPAKNRLTPRHEYVIHLTAHPTEYYYDLFRYSNGYGTGSNPGDVWEIPLQRDMSQHLAPYPEELVERILVLACPVAVCSVCGTPRRRIVERTCELDQSRPQARRAMELAEEAQLTEAHIRAIQATGISDVGKALSFQNGTGRNSQSVKELAAHAKHVLGGYFREFTFAKKKTVGWTKCRCRKRCTPGVVLDPFMGTGTTLRVAARLGFSAVGVDLVAPTEFSLPGSEPSSRTETTVPI